MADRVDALLEWSVGGSFTRLGYALRKRLERWPSPEAHSMAGRVVVITGATSGLGLEAARAFARMGATIELIARNEAKAVSVCEALCASPPKPSVRVVLADTGDLVAMRRAAKVLLERHAAIDVLIHNAGALDDERHESPEGLELTVASQVVGPFLLTALLLPALKAATASRVITVSSGGMYAEPLSVEGLEMSAQHYDGVTAYARAKRASTTLSELWAQRLKPDGIHVFAMHPGWADTPGVARSLPRFRRVVGPLLRTALQAADTLVWLAADDGVPLQHTGGFWHDRRPRPLHRLASTRRSDTPEERARLWAWAVAKSGWAGGS